MFTRFAVSALAAATLATAQTATICSQPTITINSAADASALSSCTTLSGSVVIGQSTGDIINLDGPGQISGDLTVLNNGQIVTLSSTSLNAIGGTFKLANVTILSTLAMPSLTKVGSIQWQSLPALNSLTFTSGVTSASSLTISDTFLQSLTGIDLQTVGTMDINNNKRLSDFTTSLKNLTANLNIQANGANLKVNMPNLVWIANMTISNTTSFTVPSLQVVNGSMRFDSNYFANFSAPNMTSAAAGDISFINNGNVGGISFPQLTAIGGALTIANNTALKSINGFPKLATIGGAILLRGGFSDFSLPDLSDVKGTFDASSTSSIDSSCTAINKLSPSSQGGSGVIQGAVSCTSNNANANNQTSTGTSTSTGSSSTSTSTTGSSAVSVTVNMAALGLAIVGAMAYML